jgi:hypothetical protein
MNISDHDRKALDGFWTAIDPRVPGYQHASLSYLAVRQGPDFALAQGRLHLVGKPSKACFGHFETQNVRAGHYRLAELKQAPKDIITALLSGKLQTPRGDLVFPKNHSELYSAHFDNHYAQRLEPEYRRMQLLIQGGQSPLSHPAQFDWELKASHTPFDTIDELYDEYAVGTFSYQQAKFDVIADSVAAIHPGSIIKNSRAFLRIGLADGLDKARAAIGYSLRDQGNTIARKQISGTELTWSKEDFVHVGSAEFDVPPGAILSCIANYAGEAHHFRPVTDPSTAQNPCRVVHQSFDDELEALQRLLKTQNKGKARDFEKPIAWLLWMLGFSVTHLDIGALGDGAPDLVARTPKGNFLVVECTTGLLKAEHKLANVVARTATVKRKLAESGHGHFKALSVLVTSKSREEVKVDMEQAEKSEVLVLTSDDFADLLNLTKLAPEPESLYERVEQKIIRASKPNPFSHLSL